MDAPASDVLVSRHGNLLIMVNGTSLTMAAVRQIASEIDTAARQHPAGVCTLGVVVGNTARPDPDVRAAVADMLNGTNSKEVAGSMVFMATGVTASIRRAIAQTLILASRNQRLRVNQHLADGVQFIQPKVQPAMRENLIVSMAEAMIAKVRAALPPA